MHALTVEDGWVGVCKGGSTHHWEVSQERARIQQSHPAIPDGQNRE